MKYLLKIVLLTIILPFTCYGETNSIKFQDDHSSLVQKELERLESSSNGRIGVAAINTANNEVIQYRAKERFPMGCTSKVIGVAAILKQSTVESSLLQKKVMYKKSDLVAWSPTTRNHLTDGLTVSQLCAAAIIQSDNTAMNLLVKQLGGLKTINNFANSIGNKTFRQDRGWPDEANVIGDVLDTSTPLDMMNSLQQLTLGNLLPSLQREQLQQWLKNSVTGYYRIRAGTPTGWTVGDKTGTASYGVTNDIAIIWPPKSSPIIIAIYYKGNKKNAAKRDDVVASAARILVNEFIYNDKNLRTSS